MTIGEIKIATLKLMFTNYSDKIAATDGNGNDNIVNLEEDPEYGSFLVNMNEAINRGLQRISMVGALPTKSFVIQSNSTTRNIRFDLKTIEDYGTLIRVIKESPDTYFANVPYVREETGVIRLDALRDDETYRIIYRPKIAVVKRDTPNDRELGIPDDLASILPYFVKADLFEEEEPQLAAKARNLFEQMIFDRVEEFDGHQQSVVSIYGDYQCYE